MDSIKGDIRVLKMRKKVFWHAGRGYIFSLLSFGTQYRGVNSPYKVYVPINIKINNFLDRRLEKY